MTSYDLGVDNAQVPYPAPTGCDQLSFNPSLYAQPTSTETDTASGLDVDLQVPQVTSPSVPSPSEIRATDGDAAGRVHDQPQRRRREDRMHRWRSRESGPGKPRNARRRRRSGTLTIDSSALPAPIPGYIYLSEPRPGDRYRLILAANGFNVHVKLAGSAHTDPQTGRLVVSFQNLPQTPFSDFNLHFFGSERGLLATPEQCGTYAVTSTFTPMGLGAVRTDLDPVLHPRQRPRRRSLPARRPGLLA